MQRNEWEIIHDKCSVLLLKHWSQGWKIEESSQTDEYRLTNFASRYCMIPCLQSRQAAKSEYEILQHPPYSSDIFSIWDKKFLKWSIVKAFEKFNCEKDVKFFEYIFWKFSIVSVSNISKRRILKPSHTTLPT